MRLRTAPSALRALRDERGQVLPLLATGFLVALLGVAALVIDYGQAAHKQRQLQASADAAALAGAQQLPDTALAASTAQQYGSTGTRGNAVSGFVSGSQTEVPTTAC